MFSNFVNSCGEGVPVNQDINLIFQSNSTALNISIEYINQTGFWIKNEPMTKEQNVFNYTFLNNSEIGTLRFFACDGEGTCYWCSKEVTPSGRLLSTSESIIYVMISLFIFGIFAFFLTLGLKSEWKNEVDDKGNIKEVSKRKYAKLLYLWLSFGFFMWAVQIISLITNSYVELSSARNWITRLFLYSGNLSFGVTMLFLMLFIILVWKDMLLSKQLRTYGKVLGQGRGRI